MSLGNPLQGLYRSITLPSGKLNDTPFLQTATLNHFKNYPAK